MASIGPEHRRIDRLLLVLIPVAFFVYESTRPLMTLQADVPSRFMEASPGDDSSRRASKQRAAQAYWNCALTFVQWKYTYGAPLPEDPPDDFRIDAKTYGADAAGAASRLRYWNRLREVWLLPGSWRQSREWSTSWLTEPVVKAATGLSDFFKELFRA